MSIVEGIIGIAIGVFLLIGSPKHAREFKAQNARRSARPAIPLILVYLIGGVFCAVAGLVLIYVGRVEGVVFLVLGLASACFCKPNATIWPRLWCRAPELLVRILFALIGVILMIGGVYVMLH